MSYQQWTKFWTTLDFDSEYPWNGSSYQQAENGFMNYGMIPSTFDETHLVNFGPLTKKITLKKITYDFDI